jgi:hypothetical protein
LPTNSSALKASGVTAQNKYSTLFEKIKKFLYIDQDQAMAYLDQRIWVAGLTIFILDIILWVVTLIAIILAFVGSKMNGALKGLLFFAAVLVFAIAIAYLYYLWGIAALSGSCGLIREVVTGNAKVLEDVTADADISEMVKKCFFPSDSNAYTAEQSAQNANEA